MSWWGVAPHNLPWHFYYQLKIVWNHLRRCEPQSWSHSRIIFVFHPILEYRNNFNRLLIVFFMRNLPVQFVLSLLMFEGTVGSLKSASLCFSAFFGFLECLQAGNSGLTVNLYEGYMLMFKQILLPSLPGARYFMYYEATGSVEAWIEGLSFSMIIADTMADK